MVLDVMMFFNNDGLYPYELRNIIHPNKKYRDGERSVLLNPLTELKGFTT